MSHTSSSSTTPPPKLGKIEIHDVNIVGGFQLGAGKGSACEKTILEANGHPVSGIIDPGKTTGASSSSIHHPAQAQSGTHAAGKAAPATPPVID